MKVDSNRCVGFKKCIKELGCPALSFKDKQAVIDAKLCTACGLCASVCPKNCIQKEEA